MVVKRISSKQKLIKLNKAVIDPDLGSMTVLTDDCFAYVELFIMRDNTLDTKEKEKALACWSQAKSFYHGINAIPILSRPLLIYYCFLNAVKTLLICKKKLPAKNLFHGLSGEISGNACLSNEIIKIKNKGILPALSSYFKENETRKQFCLRDLLYNLPFIHRAYILSYRHTTELFVPIKNCAFIHKKDSFGDECWLEIELSNRYDNPNFTRTLPSGFEIDKNPKYKKERKFVIRTKNRINFKNTSTKEHQLSKIADKHYVYRKNLCYIASNQRLWYLKRNVSVERIIDMGSTTITFAIMHRLSELSRYSPERLENIADTQMKWIITEFIKLAPYQFIDEISAEITGKEIMPPMIRS